MTLETLRAIHLFRDGLATNDDPPAIIDALLQLRMLGARAEHLVAAGVCLRARPIADKEWLIVTVDAHAYRFSHCCLDDETAFDTARVVQLKDSTSALASPAEPPSVDGVSGGVGRAPTSPSVPPADSSTFT